MEQKILRALILCLLIVCFRDNTNAQQEYTVEAATDPEVLVDILTGGLVETSNISFNGNYLSRGRFWGESNIGMESGIILSSGKVLDSKGPNNHSSKTSDFNFPGDEDLASMTPYNMSMDASVLEFDFVPTQNSFCLKVAMGSEEYPDYVNSSFSDVFGIFLSGPGIAGSFSSPPEFPNGSVNIALIDSNTYIAIDNINNGSCNTGPCENCQYYINNGTGSTPEINMYIQYDGLTTVFEVGANVIPNETYHLKIAVSDIADGSYDTGIFLESGSLITSQKNVLLPNVKVQLVGDQLKVSVVNSFDKPTVSIYSINGNLLYQEILNNINSVISMEEFSSGVYIVVVSTSGNSYSTKIFR